MGLGSFTDLKNTEKSGFGRMSSKKELFSFFLDILIVLATAGVYGFLILMVFKNFDSKSLQDNYKFEIKKAKDIS